jgi:AcrR family transcriptional regulator
VPRRATTDGSGSEPATTLRSQHVEATRRAVLAAARSSFGSKGYARTSVDEIAAAARVTKGAVYHHFAGKEALFRAVHAEVEGEAEARAVAARDPAGSPIDQIVAMVIDAADVIRRFDRPVLLVWGESCDFFPIADAQRLASEFPSATLRAVPGAKTWVPVDDPGVVVDAIAEFVPAPQGSRQAPAPTILHRAER